MLGNTNIAGHYDISNYACELLHQGNSYNREVGQQQLCYDSGNIILRLKGCCCVGLLLIKECLHQTKCQYRGGRRSENLVCAHIIQGHPIEPTTLTRVTQYHPYNRKICNVIRRNLNLQVNRQNKHSHIFLAFPTKISCCIF